MVFEPGPAGGSRYIVIERQDDQFRAVDQIDAPRTRAPLLFRPDHGPWQDGDRNLPAEFAARVIDRSGEEIWVSGRDPTGAVVEVPTRGGAEASHRLARPRPPGGTVRFRLRLPRRIVPRQIDILSAACSGIFHHIPPRPFPVDLSGLLRPRPPGPFGARIRDPRIFWPIPPATSICLVGDGYTAGEEQPFIDKCAEVDAAVKAAGLPMAIALKPVFRPSLEPGTDFAAGCSGPMEVRKNTAYESGYGYAVVGDCELLVGDSLPAWDDEVSVGAEFFFVLVNSSAYGGSASGDSVWFPANHPDFIDLFLHEMGHMFGLRDEYDTQLAGHFTSVQSYSNVTTDPVHPPWKGSGRIFGNTQCPAQAGYLPAASAAAGEIAAFQGASYDPCANYRPCATCKMRVLGSPFCTVCKGLMVDYLRFLAATPP